jgi:hypothetical protein
MVRMALKMVSFADTANQRECNPRQYPSKVFPSTDQSNIHAREDRWSRINRGANITLIDAEIVVIVLVFKLVSFFLIKTIHVSCGDLYVSRQYALQYHFTLLLYRFIVDLSRESGKTIFHHKRLIVTYLSKGLNLKLKRTNERRAPRNFKHCSNRSMRTQCRDWTFSWGTNEREREKEKKATKRTSMSHVDIRVSHQQPASGRSMRLY